MRIFLNILRYLKKNTILSLKREKNWINLISNIFLGSNIRSGFLSSSDPDLCKFDILGIGFGSDPFQNGPIKFGKKDKLYSLYKDLL